MDLSQEIINGNVTALSKGITLIESAKEEHTKQAEKLLLRCLPHSGNSIRIAITGIPGVGKSTFIETFGTILTSIGKKIAVLAVDPTSERTHGSILGDKSRMHKLSGDKNAFIRPSPSSGALGGVNNKTRDSIILCEAAGFEVIIIETVGVGQNETTVNNLTDFFLLLMLAGAGDELQGIKRGIIELADALIITKSDGENIQQSQKASIEYKRAFQLFPPLENGWIPEVSTCSAIENIGILEILEKIEKFDRKMIKNGWKVLNRKKQDKYWLHVYIRDELGKKQYNILKTNGKLKKLENQLKKGEPIHTLLKTL
tara:strand:+ start:9228 stop:10169 length:942 start_codon:yes stop_codon:yes gene_type:complete